MTNNPRRRTTRRVWLFRLLAVAISLAPFLLLEIGLRAIGFGYDTRLVVRAPYAASVSTFKFNPDADRAFHGRDLAGPDPRPFMIPKPAGVYRVVVVGGSGVAGFPYPLELAMPRHLEIILSEQLQEMDFEVLNAGDMASNSSSEVDTLRQIVACQPDLIVLHSGHNEFYEPGGWVSKLSSLPGLKMLRRQRLYQLGLSVVPKPTDSRLLATSPSAVPIPPGSEVFESAQDRYQANLQKILQVAVNSETPIIFSTVPSNLRDFTPLQTTSHIKLNEQDAADQAARLKEAMRLMSYRKYGGALATFKEARRVDATHPLLAYREAQCLEMLQRGEEAATSYALAADLDGYRLRAPSSISNVVREVARSAPEQVYLCDVEAEFRSRSHFAENDLFLGHVHYNLEGNWQAAQILGQFIVQDILGATWDDDRIPNDERRAELLRISPFDDLVAIAQTVDVLESWPFNEAPDRQTEVRLLQDLSRKHYAALSPLDQELFARLSLSTTSRNLLTAMGDAYLAAGQRELAQAAFQRHISRRPWDATAYISAIVALRTEGDVLEAQLLLDRLRNVAPGDPRVDELVKSAPDDATHLLGNSVSPIQERMSSEESHRQMLHELQSISDNTQDAIEWLGGKNALQLRQTLAQLPSSSPPAQHYIVRNQLAYHELRLGNERDAIELLLECEQIMARRGAFPLEIAAQMTNELRFELGVAHMRLAETENCCSQNTPDSCVIPIRGSGIHTATYGSAQAIEWFERILENEPIESQLWLRTLWLYNVASMTLDRYPNQVPKAWRVPEAIFQADGSFPAFTNIAQRVGLDTFSLSGGAIADDFDEDGEFDLVVSTYDTHGQILFFHNQGRGAFVDRTKQAGLTGLFGGLNLVQVDYDNDGFLDILVLRGGWFGDSGRHPNSLLHNNGDGTFTDVSFRAGLEARAPTQTASWADYDHDGDLDLYIGNETNRAVPIPSQLYQNNGDGTFSDVAEQSGVLNSRFAKAVVWGDYDHDRFPDLYVSNYGEANRLYRNKGDGTFIDVADRLGVAGPMRSFPAWFWDFNNDGILDIYVSAYSDDLALLAASYLNRKHAAEPTGLYQGNGSGGFANVSEAHGLTTPVAPMGSNFGDLDNDGFLDFYLGTGEPEYKNLMPNVMYHNECGERFVDVTMAGRFGHLQKGHAVVFADLDRDGDQDVFEQLGGAYPGDRFYDCLFENPGFDNNWIAISLVGTQSNRAAVGARIHLRVAEPSGQQRSIYRHVNSGGSFGANPMRQSIGIGKAERIELLEVFWPTTGQTHEIRDLPANQAIRIVEGQPGHWKLKREH
jgi:tetratricopeptide (TPR) repeat protein